MRVEAVGASGSGGNLVDGGNGGIVKATIPVTPGETLGVYVGGAGGDGGGKASSGGGGGGAGGGYEKGATRVKSSQGTGPVGNGQIVISWTP